MIKRDLTLEDNRILLRPMEMEDIPELLAMTSSKEVWKFYTHDLSTHQGFLDWAEPHFKGERLQFSITDKLSGLMVGATAFGNFSPRDSRLEIGWTWMGKNFQGKGINPLVKRLMLAYCFDDLELERVEFKKDVLNVQARKSLKNIGAIEEGVLRSHTLMTQQRRRDTIYYSILKSEWQFVKRENDW